MNLQSARSVKSQVRFLINDELFERGIEHGIDDIPTLTFGVARGANEDDFKLAVRARSEQDLPPEIEEMIRDSADGEIDLRFTGPVEAKPAASGTASRRLFVGASVGHYRCATGTLGFFARRNDDGVVGIVSNNHVLAFEDRGKDGDSILHPGLADAGRLEDTIAFLDGRYPKLHKQRLEVDCAFAPLAPGVSYDPRPLGTMRLLSPMSIGPDRERYVTKVGRTTGKTDGRITAFEFEPFYVDYTFGSVRVENQIEIESTSEKSFSAPGDSGSLVFTSESHQPVGLLFASSAAGGTFGTGLSYANPIDAVLAALGVTLIT